MILGLGADSFRVAGRQLHSATRIYANVRSVNVILISGAGRVAHSFAVSISLTMTAAWNFERRENA